MDPNEMHHNERQTRNANNCKLHSKKIVRGFVIVSLHCEARDIALLF